MNKKISTSLGLSLLIATNIYSADKLDTITVTSATKSSQSIKDVTSSIEVITSEELEERNFVSVPEALNTIAGINVISNGGLGKATSVFIRGFDSQRVLVLIDGINYNDFTGISGANFEHLMLDNIKQIEIIKGSQSGIWGADANAGVINIVTKKAKKGSHGSALVELGSFNTKKFNASLSHKTDIFDFKFGVSKIETDGFTSKAPRGLDVDSFENDGYKNRTVSVKTGYKINDNNKIILNHNQFKAESEYDNNVYDSSFTLDQIKSANNGEDESTTRNSYSSINFINKSDYADLKIYTNYSKIDRDDPTGNTKEFDGTLREYGLNSKFSYFDKSSFLLLGLDSKITNHKNNVNKELNNKAVFATNSTKFNNTVFVQSLRYDKYDLFNNKTTGKIGVKHNFNKDFYLSSNYGTSYNTPNFYKLYNAYAGYSELQPESTKSADFKVSYKGLGVTYFYNKISNMIEYNTSTDKYYNMDGEVTLKGLEVSYKKEIIKNLLANLNYTRTNAKDENNKDLQRRVKDSLKFGFDYYGIDNLHINLNGEYVGDRFQYTYATYDISARTGNYTVWNSVMNYEINKTFSTYLKVDNLFNKYYQTIDGYATAERSAYIGLKATF